MATHSIVDYTTKIKSFFSSKQELEKSYAIAGKLGAKNLVPYPYPHPNGGYGGMSFIAQSDGSYLINGSSSSYSHRCPYTATQDATENCWEYFNLPSGEYTVSLSVDNIEKITSGTISVLARFYDKRVSPSIVTSYSARIGDSNTPQTTFNITQEMVELLNSGDMHFELRIATSANSTINNIIVYPMIRLASDTDPTWQPYVMTNKELTDKISEVITPEMFGAKGDGITDDTFAIRAALNVGKTVHLSSKSYLISDTLVMNTRQAIVGEGKQSIILVSGANTIGIKIPATANYCEIKHLLIKSATSTRSGSYGILIEDYSSSSSVYDSCDVIEDVKIQNINGTGLYIGHHNRGCCITNVGVSNCNGHGIYVAGTDNMLCNVGAGSCTKHGIYLYQNNRLYSAKAFVCGTDRSEEYFSLFLAGNYNNIACYDLQQSTYDGIYVGGSGNNISFASDGVGYNNTDYDAHVSVLVFGNYANSNRIVGTVTQGTLHGMFNHLVKTQGLCQNNHIELTYQSVIYYPKDVYKVEGVLSPDNYYHVNNEDKNTDWQYVQVDKNNFSVIYKSQTTGQSTTKSTTTGSIEIDDLYMPLAVGAGTFITFDDINDIISNGNYSYCYAEIKLRTNFPILPQCRLNPAFIAIYPDSSIDIQPSGVHFINSDYVYSDMKCICSKLDNYTPYALRFVIRNNSTESISSSEFGVDNILIEVEDIKFAYI